MELARRLNITEDRQRLRRSSQPDPVAFAIPNDRGAPAAARRALERLSAWVPDDALNAARLAITEVVTNSVQHAGARAGDVVKLTLSLTGDVLMVSVIDSGPGFRPPAGLTSPDADATSGRGLPILDRLAERWGVEPEIGRVWFEIALSKVISGPQSSSRQI
jgi:anti-sigma regulatory factor (Ser/Thr protein kinase)